MSTRNKFFVKCRVLLRKAIKFVTDDIWKKDNAIANLVEIIWISIVNFGKTDLYKKATALTFNTMLAIVPMLAVVLAIARGFGFQSVVENLLLESNSNTEVVNSMFEYVNSYMEKARGGVFMGVGIVILFVSVVNVLRSVEGVFNKDVWYVEKSRNIFQQFVNYISVIVVVPILIILMSGFSVYVSSAFANTALGGFFAPVVTLWMKILSYLVVCLFFTLIYWAVPNTKVKLMPALIAGAVAGSAFQFFQLLYIDGQIWVSSYNAIYGSFAALPLLMLWLQLSYSILLYGATLSFACQNAKFYKFNKQIGAVSPYFKNFMYLVIMNIIVKRFEEIGEKPVSSDELVEKNKIPYQLAAQLTADLEAAKLLVKKETSTEDVYYIPAFDIHKMTVALVFEKLEKRGFSFKDFRFDDPKFKSLKETYKNLFRARMDSSAEILIKDL